MPEIAHKRRQQGSTKWNQYTEDFLPLWVADMDFVVCPEISEALKQRINNETFGYTNTWPSLYESVINWCKKHYDWEIEADWIVWTQGIVPAFVLTNQLFNEQDDTILIPTPNYPPLLNSAKNLGQNYQLIPHYYADNQWHLDFETLENTLKTTKVSILTLANPANPSGYSFTKAELIKLTQLCEEHDVLICSDEIHCDLIFDNKKHHPIGKIAPKHSITLMAASKTFNIAGLNTAFAIIPNNEIRKKFKTAAYQRIGSPTQLGYTATEAAFTKGEPWLKDTLQYLKENRDIIHKWGKDKNLENHYLPTATHLYWLKIPPQKWIDQKVMPSNGTDFGDAEYSRINFACDRGLLLTALDSLSGL